MSLVRPASAVRGEQGFTLVSEFPATQQHRNTAFTAMRFDVLTLFPEIFDGFLSQSLLRSAIERGLVEIKLWDFREWARDKRKSVDDKPYGGGPGMLLCCQPIFDCLETVQAEGAHPGQLVMLTPQGRRLDQALVRELAGHERLVMLCGRYEGFDERIRLGLKPLEVSVGDFVTNGGEVPAMLVIDAVIRLVPGVLGDEASHRDESFAPDGLLEYPQYTRPREFRGMKVPDILLTGNHEQIARWRHTQRLLRTMQRRRDLLEGAAEAESSGAAEPAETPNHQPADSQIG